ncbi:MAG: oligosaccharide flippase family protein [Oscillospiraceae bacterium]
MREKGQSFLGGAAVLMAAALVVKTIGALFKIPLTQIIGGSGMGYFMTAYGFFNPIYALSVAGFPVAVSKLTAQSLALGRRDEAREILTAALLVFLPVGLLLSAGIFFGANRFVTLIGNPGAGQAVLAIAPAVFLAFV